MTPAQAQAQSTSGSLDALRPNLRQELNAVSQEPEFSKDTYAGAGAEPLPQTLEEYKESVSVQESFFEDAVTGDTTFQLMRAASIIADEEELLSHLVKDYFDKKLLPIKISTDPQNSIFDNIKTPLELNHSSKINGICVIESVCQF